MQFGEVLLELERGSELIVQGVGIVAHHVEPAALGRPFRTERRHDDVTAQPDRMGHMSDVCSPQGRVGQEVEHRSVVPHIVVVPREGERRDITR